MTKVGFKKYDPPKEESYWISRFGSSKRSKKSLREFMFYPESQRLFINVALLDQYGILCAMCDGITMCRYDNKKSPCFIDCQWAIDEKIGGKELAEHLQRLFDEVKERHKNGGFAEESDK